VRVVLAELGRGQPTPLELKWYGEASPLDADGLIVGLQVVAAVARATPDATCPALPGEPAPDAPDAPAAGRSWVTYAALGLGLAGLAACALLVARLTGRRRGTSRSGSSASS
jgi:hypothetical protein